MSFCTKCGARLEKDGLCPSCGPSVTSSAPSAPAVPSAPSSPQRGSRPSGITILAVLEGIVSFFALLGGAALLVFSAFLASGGLNSIPEIAEALQQIPWASTFIGVPTIALTTAFLTGIGIVLLILAVLGFIMTWGLWSGKSWARTITMILSVLGIVTGIFSVSAGNVISILIDVAILYYLTRPLIRAYYQ